MSFNRLFFGTAGIPISTPEPRSTQKGVEWVRGLGLDALELEFVHSVNLNEQKALQVKNAAEKNNICLTCHGSYYINLNSADEQKVNDSVQRILQGARVAEYAGASSITFHAAFYQKVSPEQTFSKVKKELEKITAQLKSTKNKILIRPETTGKATQFGSLEELLELSSQLEQVLPCIDFSHLHARSAGKLNSYPEFVSVLEKSEKALGKEFLKNLHCHVSGIAYTEKGERNHLELKDSDFKYKELIQALKEFNCAGTIICESPNIEEDALLLKKTFEKLG
jgi:deoxyribonuclease-4